MRDRKVCHGLEKAIVSSRERDERQLCVTWPRSPKTVDLARLNFDPIARAQDGINRAPAELELSLRHAEYLSFISRDVRWRSSTIFNCEGHYGHRTIASQQDFCRNTRELYRFIAHQ